MDEASKDVLSNPYFANKSNKEIIKGYKEWFKNFEMVAQDCFVDIFKVQTDISYETLPHVAAFLGYTLTRIYENFSLGLLHRGNDSYDRACFVDAVAVDYLITNDESFIRSCLRVPCRSFDVIRIDELASLVKRCHTNK